MQNTSKSSSPSDSNDNKNHRSEPSALFYVSCSRKSQDFTTNSLKANLLDQICGTCNERFEESPRKGKYFLNAAF